MRRKKLPALQPRFYAGCSTSSPYLPNPTRYSGPAALRRMMLEIRTSADEEDVDADETAWQPRRKGGNTATARTAIARS